MDGWLLASPCAAAALCSCFFSALQSDGFSAVRFVVFGRSVPLAEGSGCPVNVKSYDGPSCDDVDPGDGGSYDDAFAQSIEKSRSDVKVLSVYSASSRGPNIGCFCSDDVAGVPEPKSECCGVGAACCKALSSAVL